MVVFDVEKIERLILMEFYLRGIEGGTKSSVKNFFKRPYISEEMFERAFNLLENAGCIRSINKNNNLEKVYSIISPTGYARLEVLNGRLRDEEIMQINKSQLAFNQVLTFATIILAIGIIIDIFFKGIDVINAGKLKWYSLFIFIFIITIVLKFLIGKITQRYQNE